MASQYSNNANNDFEMGVCTQSRLQIAHQHSVYLRNATKTYGFKYNEVLVFNNLNVTVPKGKIYALLGASGCGKTTLLSCILGYKKLNHGQIWVLGGTPGTKFSKVPGPHVGYMPQDTALYGSFTIDETLLYFGWVAGMSTKQITSKCKFLKELLMLDHTNETIRNLSGGEQRRVSLAVALIHDPELLVLDEPTVGIDPIVRRTVWNYMLKLAQENNTTIIITTHYIEETRQADIVALMRKGTFLAEESPESLICRFGGSSLEETFLRLSTIQNNNISKLQDSQFDHAENYCNAVNQNDLPVMPPEPQPTVHFTDFIPNFSIHRIKALLFKGFLWMGRNVTTMTLITALPFLIISIFCFTVGRSPVDLPVAIINHETQNSLNCNSLLTCKSSQLSCCYTKYLENLGVNLIYYSTEEEAVSSVVNGDNYASIVIRENYTKALLARIENVEAATPWELKNSEIDVFRDVTHKQIAIYLKMYLYKTFQDFLQDLMEACGRSRKSLQIPINFEDPVYGVMEPNLTDSVVPGIVLLIVFILSVATTSVSMLMERNEGNLERTYTIGIRDEELLLSHFICEFCITLAQAILTIFGAFFVFSMTMKGSLLLVFLICCLAGVCGMCYGLFISCVCDKEITASLIATGSLVPILIVCGIIWPIEAMGDILKPFVHLLPFTTANTSLRSILQKGWGITNRSVYLGFFSLSAWSLVLIVISIILLKLKK